MNPSNIARIDTEDPRSLDMGPGFKRPSIVNDTPYDVVVIGGGQAGLSTGYFLAKRGLSFVILDAQERTGDVWRKRWDSLRLFTPARYDGLVGMPFPAPPDSFPTKDEFADYLEAYAKAFSLPVQNSTRVQSITKKGNLFQVRAGNQVLQAHQVVVAMANYQQGRCPEFCKQLDPSIVQLHSSEYQSPEQLGAGDVLIAGAGNSGAEIALELSGGRRVWMAGRDTGAVPFRIDGFWARLILSRLVLRFLFHYVLTIKTPIGRKARSAILHKGGPLIRAKHRDLERAGVQRVGKVIGTQNGRPLLDDGRTLSVNNVIWCTGYYPAFDWIHLPVFNEHGEPRHVGGIATDVTGLYFVGLHFQYSMSSTMIHGVGRDAERIVNAIARMAASAARRSAQAS
jgi:putative flavoprotein involved in K+ transport